ncbi:SDH family Clp fold serine proteinase [Neisseria sp. Ec49-e6-T10]|uniref:SDH family Clp fold serine proteinase n=1 Tax=Neisseria sp. Ec49-e6-T10 TaxID=3140744 RepID=UPI003EBBFA4E
MPNTVKINQEDEFRDYWLINSPIHRHLYEQISYNLSNIKHRQNCTMFLTTYGGDPDAAFRIARALGHYYNEIRIVIPSYCKSAGTLIAIGAHHLAIGDMGELGPLDVQVHKQDEYNESGSGLDAIQALEACLEHAQRSFVNILKATKSHTNISTRLAGDLAAKLASGVLSSLYTQIDPNRVAEMQRAMSIAMHYGGRLNKKTGNLKGNALIDLATSYPSHGFVIDRKEAASLFNRVSDLNMLEKNILEVEEIWGKISNPSGKCIVENINLVADPIIHEAKLKNTEVKENEQIDQSSNGKCIQPHDMLGGDRNEDDHSKQSVQRGNETKSKRGTKTSRKDIEPERESV